MKIEELKPGMYEITEDVKNPKADRRKSERNFSAWPIWTKGKRVCVRPADPEHPNLWNIFRAFGYADHGVRGRKGGQFNHPGFEALLAALRPVPWTEREWVEVHISNGNWILERLLKANKITYSDLEKILEGPEES